MTYPPPTLTTDFDNNTPILNEHPGAHNDTNLAINDIVAVLGTSPQGAYQDVATRLTAIAANTVVTIAASNTPSNQKTKADVVCTGTADDVLINTAITNLPAAGGKLVFLQGTYNLAATINLAARTNVIFEGVGPSTIFKQQTGVNIHMFSTSSPNAAFLYFKDFTIDGSRSVNSSNGQGIRFSGAASDIIIERLYIHDTFSNAISVNGSRIHIRHNIIRSNNAGVLLNSGASDCWLVENDITSIGVLDVTTADAISNQGTRNRFFYNRCQASDTGINLAGEGHVVIGNHCFQNGNSGINSGGGSHLVVIGNQCWANGRKTATPRSNAGIRIRDHITNPVTTTDSVFLANVCWEDLTNFPLGVGALGQIYGVEIAQANGHGIPDYNIVTHNNVRSVAPGGAPMQLTSVGANMQIKDNIGVQDLGGAADFTQAFLMLGA